ncbi:BRcat domain-containing protein, partial [Klebsiella pneumoniae]
MAEHVPCPNPACNAIFTPESLRGAARFTCPSCGLLFQFRAAPEQAPASRTSSASGKSAARR